MITGKHLLKSIRVTPSPFRARMKAIVQKPSGGWWDEEKHAWTTKPGDQPTPDQGGPAQQEQQSQSGGREPSGEDQTGKPAGGESPAAANVPDIGEDISPEKAAEIGPKAKKATGRIKSALVKMAKAGKAIAGAPAEAGARVARGLQIVSDKVVGKINDARGKKEGDKGYIDPYTAFTALLTRPLSTIADWFGANTEGQADDIAEKGVEQATGVGGGYAVMKILFAAGGWAAAAIKKKLKGAKEALHDVGLAPGEQQETPDAESQAQAEQDAVPAWVSERQAQTVPTRSAEQEAADGAHGRLKEAGGDRREAARRVAADVNQWERIAKEKRNTPAGAAAKRNAEKMRRILTALESDGGKPQGKSLSASPFRYRMKAFRTSKSGKRCYDDSQKPMKRVAMSNCDGHASQQSTQQSAPSATSQSVQSSGPTAPKKRRAAPGGGSEVAKKKPAEKTAEKKTPIQKRRSITAGAMVIGMIRGREKYDEHALSDLLDMVTGTELVTIARDVAVKLNDRPLSGEVRKRIKEKVASKQPGHAEKIRRDKVMAGNPKFADTQFSRDYPFVTAAMEGDETAIYAMVDQALDEGRIDEEQSAAIREQIADDGGPKAASQRFLIEKLAPPLEDGEEETPEERFARGRNGLTRAYRVMETFDWDDQSENERGRALEAMGFEVRWEGEGAPPAEPVAWIDDRIKTARDAGLPRGYAVAIPRKGGVPLAYDTEAGNDAMRWHTAVAPSREAFQKVAVRLQQLEWMREGQSLSTGEVLDEIRKNIPDLKAEELWAALNYASRQPGVDLEMVSTAPVDGAVPLIPARGELPEDGILYRRGLAMAVRFGGRTWDDPGHDPEQNPYEFDADPGTPPDYYDPESGYDD